MADEFDLFLRPNLAPPARGPDRSFLARVQARIAVEERLRAERGGHLRRLGMEVLALAAVAAALLCLGRAPAVAELAGRSPALALSVLLGGFGLLILAFAWQGSGWSRAPDPRCGA